MVQATTNIFQNYPTTEFQISILPGPRSSPSAISGWDPEMLRKFERRLSFQPTTCKQQLCKHKSLDWFWFVIYFVSSVMTDHSPAPRRLPGELQCWQMKPTPQLKVPAQEHPATVEEYHNPRRQHRQLFNLSRELVSRGVPRGTKDRLPLVDEVVCVRHTVLGIMMMIVIKIKTMLGGGLR